MPLIINDRVDVALAIGAGNNMVFNLFPKRHYSIYFQIYVPCVYFIMNSQSDFPSLVVMMNFCWMTEL